MIRFEFTTENEIDREADYTRSNVTLTRDNVQDLDIYDMFYIWKDFMGGMGYNMSGYDLIREE